MNTLSLTIGAQTVTVYALVSTRAVVVSHVVRRGRRTWAKNEKGRIYCDRLSELRGRNHWPASADVLNLSEDDIFALGQLGVIDAKAAAKLKDTEQYRKDFKHKHDWLAGDVDTVREAGIKLAPDWKARVDLAAHKYAKGQQTKRRARDKAQQAARAAGAQ